MIASKSLRAEDSAVIVSIPKIQKQKSGTETSIIESEPKTDSQAKIKTNNYYNEWQAELKARKNLEAIVASLQNQIRELEKRVTILDCSNNCPAQPAQQGREKEYLTDEEELALEIGSHLKKNKRPTKKRKAEDSPELSARRQDAKQANLQGKTSDKRLGKLTTGLKKQPLPPPIMISGVDRFGELKKVIEKKTKKSCKFTSYNNNKWKINVDDSDTYREITEELTKTKFQWHSYENKATRPVKVVARGLHFSCDEHDIVEDLSNKKFRILEAKNLIKKETTRGSDGRPMTINRKLSLFMLSFHNQEEVEKIYNIKSIMGIVVKIEPLRKNSNSIPQCKRCQAFGHTQSYCKRDFACVKCEGKHPTNNCPLKKDEKAKCINCHGDHPANYRGCPMAKEYQERKSKATKINQRNTSNNKSKQQVNAENKKLDKVPIAAKTNIPVESKSYSQIVKNTRKEEEISIKEMLITIIQRLDNQDKIIKLLSKEAGKKQQNIND